MDALLWMDGVRKGEGGKGGGGKVEGGLGREGRTPDWREKGKEGGREEKEREGGEKEGVREEEKGGVESVRRLNMRAMNSLVLSI